MLKKIFTGFLICIFMLNAQAQIPSPESFLGYKIGKEYTPHWKIVDYFKKLAATAPEMVKLEEYGTTYEGRSLLLAFVSSPENMKNLESIRMNNIRLANMAKDKRAPMEDQAPAIVWLSFNVHGNEASSSEAAMMTIWALVNPENNTSKAWLKNTVVVIDPCLNPDGRDRYVNWYRSVKGKYANPQLMSREHDEPSPQGRVNHYYFDLNRDWVWQIQKESEERLAAYNQWLPQVHVDFHEQYFNNPYYFPPAAEPFHEVITPWQRTFQKMVGQNNAKYFDKNGWLYFTGEVFDLFYPSYGDTYPLFNGAIGMTYEQAGHSRSGTAVITDEGDTLTLFDRANHHYTAALSTIEIASQKAPELIQSFRKYFNTAVASGIGKYKSYVIKNNQADKERIDVLLSLLDKNKIRYAKGSGTSKGYDYITGKETTFNYKDDIVINAAQPKSVLIKVLFEPKSQLVDSVTYDITAWSLPYVFGVQAYACEQKINEDGPVESVKVNNETTTYGYAIPWLGVPTAKAVGKILQKGIVLRYAEKEFEVDQMKFKPGTVLVLRTANKKFGSTLFETVRAIADENKIQLYPVSTGFVEEGPDFGSSSVHAITAPNVVLLTGEDVDPGAVGEVWYFFDHQLDYPINLVNVSAMKNIDWSKVDVLILPDGYYSFLSDKGYVNEFKQWIQQGGRVIAMEGAVNAFAQADFGIKNKSANKANEKDDEKDDADYSLLRKFGDRERDYIPNTTPGSIYKVSLDNSHPLAFGYPDYYFTLKKDSRVFEFIKNGWNVGVIKKDDKVAGFVGANLQRKLQDGLIFGVQQMGRGTITYLTDDVLFREFWENGKLLFCNAVFFVGQ